MISRTMIARGLSVSTFSLEVLTGADRGKLFALSDGARIGRSIGEVIINDPKISSRHAQIKVDQQGFWWIHDLGSVNGIKINGERIQRAQLSHGLIMQIGRTSLRAIETSYSNQVLSELESSEPDRLREAMLEFEEQNQKPQAAESVTVSSALRDYLLDFVALLEEEPIEVYPFENLLEFRCLRGLQMETVWTLGYGPRYFGINSVDISLLDPEMGEGGFTISPSEEGPSLRPDPGSRVLVNGKEEGEVVLHEGDIISFGETEIQMRFVK